MLERLNQEYSDLWDLDPGVIFLNHGSFGATPRAIMERQHALQLELEREPVRFFTHTWRPLLDASREALARFVGARPDDLVFVPNATHGVNTILSAVAPTLKPGDELVVTNHGYGACNAAARATARRTGATLVVAQVPGVLSGPEDVTQAVMAAIRPDKTKLLLIDHITSLSGVIFPLDEIVPRVQAMGVDVLVDGAHAPGQIPLDLDQLGAAYYTGNCHKWLCAPKGSALLHIRRDRQQGLHPLVISQGYDMPLEGRSRLHEEFDWMGTVDPTPYLCIRDVIALFEDHIPGGWEAIRQRNHQLAIAARQLVSEALGAPTQLAPAAMHASMSTVALPDGPLAQPLSAAYAGSLPDRLLTAHGIQSFMAPFPAPPRRLIRLSAQLYNRLDDYHQLASALRAELEHV